jgi:serine/threonine protein kinase
MSGDSSQQLNSPIPMGRLAIDSICNQFEMDWKAGRRHNIEEFVQNVAEPDLTSLLGELLQLEVELRQRAGDHPVLEDYWSRFPHHRTCVRAALQVHSQLPSTMDAFAMDARPRPDLTPLTSQYVIHERIGQGGLGTVYRATKRNFPMQVAIKVITRDFSAARFLREVSCVVKFRSPHIVTIHDCETLPDGTSILVMEWMEGGDLGMAMQAHGGKLPEHVVLPWMRQTCEGMIAIEEQHCVHRDLKPSNIMIDGQGRAKVADFDFVRQIRDGDISRDGQILGTISYMAPEQADAVHVDNRSDIYSFGACFYHALTGRPPFEGPTDLSILSKHKHEPLVSPRIHNPEISQATSELLERCLAKSPADRFQSFRDVLDFIQSTPWDQLEDKALGEYVAMYQSRRKEYLARARAIETADIYSFPEGRTLRILVGDIVDQEVEAIVSSDDWLLTKVQGVSKAILTAAGREILAELQCIPVRPGRAVVSTGGSLKAKRIFHAVVTGGERDDQQSQTRELVIEALQSCLYHADSFFVRSIAFPLIGTGACGFSEEACLDAMFRLLARNLLSGKSQIRDARIVLYPRPTRYVIREQIDRPTIPGYTIRDHVEHIHNEFIEFFNYLSLPGGRIAIFSGILAGHSSAADDPWLPLIEAAKGYLQDSLPTAFSRLNDNMMHLSPSHCVSALLTVLDPRQHQLTIYNAGHVPPLWRRSNRRVELLGESQAGLPLGLHSNQTYEPFVLTISPGESIVVVTDGVVEAASPQGTTYGIDRVQQQIAATNDSEEIVPELIEGVRQFASSGMQAPLCAISFYRR